MPNSSQVVSNLMSTCFFVVLAHAGAVLRLILFSISNITSHHIIKAFPRPVSVHANETLQKLFSKILSDDVKSNLNKAKIVISNQLHIFIFPMVESRQIDEQINRQTDKQVIRYK